MLGKVYAYRSKQRQCRLSELVRDPRLPRSVSSGTMGDRGLTNPTADHNVELQKLSRLAP